MKASNKNNFIAGLFLIVSVILGVAVSAVLSDLGDKFVPKNSYIVKFDLTDGASGIVAGSPVLIGGREAGRVTHVAFAHADGADPTIAPTVDVEILLPRSIVLYENALPTLAQPLIGSMSAINIVSLGSPTGVDQVRGQSSVLEPGETLQGALAPPSFVAAAGFGPDEADAVKRIIHDVETTVARFDQMTFELDEKLTRILDDVTKSADDVAVLTENLREKAPQWTDDIDELVVQLSNAAESANLAINEARVGVDDAVAFVADVRATLDDNRPKIDNIMDNVDAATTRINDESLDLLNSTLVSVDEGAAEFAALAAEAGAILAERAPEIRRTLSNVRLASDQLKLTLIEVRRNPWRLLYRPGAKETQTEVLYDAARAYAVAVSDLRAASESLEIASAREKPDSDAVKALLAELNDAFSRFEQTEQRLLERLLQD